MLGLGNLSFIRFKFAGIPYTYWIVYD